MSWEVWAAFVVASSVVLLVPGPTVILVVSYALARGRRSAWATVPGVTLGDFTAMTASLFGAGAVLAVSASLFSALKLAGAAYLIWIGIKLWRTDPHPEAVEPGPEERASRSLFWNAYVVTALNPKSIVFFVAFVPQFVDPARPALPQFAILEATFLVLAAADAAIWATLAGTVRSRLRWPGTLRIANRVGAAFLVGAGVITAVVRRGS